jgi:S1-C subfamily serine protease
MPSSLPTTPRSPRRVGVVIVALLVLWIALASCIEDPGGTTRGPGPTRATATTNVETGAVGELSDDELIEATRRSLVRVRSTGCDGVGVGTGWLIDPGQVITNRHVVEGAHTIELLTWDGRDLEAKGAAASVSADLAVIRVDQRGPLRPLPVRVSPVREGERIGIVGFPEGGRLTVSTGVTVDYVSGEDATAERWLRTTTVIHPGNSGGPAVDMSGRVVGTVFAELIRDDYGLVIPIDEALALDTARLEQVEGGC